MAEKLQLLKKNILKNKKVIVYGAGQNAGATLAWLSQTEFGQCEIYVAVTRKAPKQIFHGYVVQNIEELVDLNKEAVVLVSVFEGFFNEINIKLTELGFENVINMEDWFVEEAFYKSFWELPIDENKVVVENFHGLGYGDSPKYIVQELLKRTEELDIVWVLKPGVEEKFPKGIRTVEMYSLDFYREVATAKVWICNVRKYQTIRKREGQYYIQTWHGFPLKTIEKDAEAISNGISKSYFDAGKKDSKMVDLLLSNAGYLTKIYKQTFWYDGDIVEWGYPRNDVFFETVEESKRKVREYYELSEDTKIVMYAPTFRNNYSMKPYDLNFDGVLKALKAKYGGNWVMLLRMHPNVAAKARNYEYSSELINATPYDDMMELLAATDVLVTDYSSSMFDISTVNTPVFLFSNDIERYINKDRGFYFEYRSLPFPIAEDNDQLIGNIERFDYDKYVADLQLFKKKIGFMDDGMASKRVADLVLEKTAGKD